MKNILHVFGVFRKTHPDLRQEMKCLKERTQSNKCWLEKVYVFLAYECINYMYMDKGTHANFVYKLSDQRVLDSVVAHGAKQSFPCPVLAVIFRALVFRTV